MNKVMKGLLLGAAAGGAVAWFRSYRNGETAGDATITAVRTGAAAGAVGGLAIGLVLVYKGARVFNFAQGEFLVIGGWTCWWVMLEYQLPFWIGFPLTLAFMVVFGMLLQVIVLRPMIGEPIISVVMVTIGLSIFFQALMKWMFGVATEPFPPIHPNFALNPATGRPFLISEMDAGQLWSAYIRYIGAGAVLASGLITLARTLPTIVASARGSFRDLSAGAAGSAARVRTERDIPMIVVLGGSLVLGLFLAVSPGLPTQGNVLAAILILVFGFFFATVSSRITGLIGTSSNPISGMTIATLILTCLLFVALGAVSWLTMARIVRSQVMAVKKMEFIEAARSLGFGRLRIIFRHILPNILGPIIVYTTLTIPAVMLLEAFLSFLGLGVQPPMSSWGLLIKEGAEMMEEAPWLLLYPAALFTLTLFSLNFLGDGLRDALDVRASRD